ETVTADLSLNSMTSGYLDHSKTIEDACAALPSGFVVFAGVCMGLALCGLVGNGTVVWFLCFHVKQNPFTVYILNLAIADFFLLLLFFLLALEVFSFIVLCSYLYTYVAFYIDSVFVVEFLCHFFDLSSMSLLAAISVERSISVL
ncbi:MAS protein, partial [Centropus unirufus]|nr:MAS protein [Centropus unirufus]